MAISRLADHSASRDRDLFDVLGRHSFADRFRHLTRGCLADIAGDRRRDLLDVFLRDHAAGRERNLLRGAFRHLAADRHGNLLADRLTLVNRALHVLNNSAGLPDFVADISAWALI